jgi:ribosomal protein L7Ae-like RNA K-turn-binding protein
MLERQHTDIDSSYVPSKVALGRACGVSRTLNHPQTLHMADRLKGAVIAASITTNEASDLVSTVLADLLLAQV